MTEKSLEIDNDFDLLQTGVCGRFEAVPARQSTANTGLELPLCTLPAGLPPIVPDDAEILEQFLTCPEQLSIHDDDKTQGIWGRKMRPESLYHMGVCPLQSTITVDRNPTSGQLLGFKEEMLADTGSTSQNSTSLNRPPGAPGQGVKGSSANYPFWPGGLEEPDFADLNLGVETEKIDFNEGLLTVPPGMSKGMTFEPKKLESILLPSNSTGVLNLADILEQGGEIDFDLEEPSVKDKEEEEAQIKPDANAEELAGVDEIIKLPEREVPYGESYKTKEQEEEWAVMLDTKKPVQNFHKKIPHMAYEWPFELDTFQKQAILNLEGHNNVFVAAHTSAGKTVVAEYAIALSMKHMTRTVYTSPIKALSNQKFRDFRQTFEDVGLITGDIQLNPEAACLIMTTEILRSMLYNGSDVIRDLEWVIFDEVHYINDSERGVVWEEVLIMLPQHVNIVMLSATVPNTAEFAGWVGRTKRKKVYVVSTTKRPVPLEHYLYTGNSNKTSTELFKIVDAAGSFLTQGYNKAVDAKKERTSKSAQSFGPKGARSGGHPHQDKNVWLSVIEMLKKKDKLPAVAFTFSRKKIKELADNLQSVDLLTASEKSEVHRFFQKCMSRLKGTDKNLPQVTFMCDLLKKGLGMHHSGILPILKETVELLFQKGLVKILFATETFAMGVNMPTRTVLFDTVRKHDGKCFRDLLPSEYIQMAGRAGRRGLDSTGTVVILCKGDVQEMSELHKMMLGKPTHLESQFRLTYTMILNLLRVEQLRVEDMMKRSFSEFHNQRDVGKRQETLEELTHKIADLPDVVDYSGDLQNYYDTCNEYWQLKMELQKVTLSHPHAIKALCAGRVVVVDNATHTNTLGAVLKCNTGSSKGRTFTTLVICEQTQPTESNDIKASDKEIKDQMPRPFSTNGLFHPEGACGHEVVDLTAEHITAITTKMLKVNTDKIIDDFKKRQIPRFRNDPPGQSVSVTTQELLRLVEANPSGLPGLDAIKDIGIRDIELVEKFRRLSFLEESFRSFMCVHDTNFHENFALLRENMKVHEELNKLKYLLSDASLQLLPEYQQRIQVLRELHYIDESSTVQLKGRVACEMSQHELIITELVFENALTHLHPSEIAALLSCIVFEQKNCSEPNLCKSLETAKEGFLKVAKHIGQLQRDCGLEIPVQDYVESFHFNLMEVVFEWARGLPFSDIINLTDVQEGIIVRCIQRLDEVIKDVRNAARIIGDPVLYQKMEEASSAIKRDIVFAASLYTQ